LLIDTVRANFRIFTIAGEPLPLFVCALKSLGHSVAHVAFKQDGKKQIWWRAKIRSLEKFTYCI